MKRWLTVAVVVLAAGLGVTLLARTQAPQWTSDSPEARAEMDAANQARMKLYYSDANDHLRRAIELDPDFVTPKAILLTTMHADTPEAKSFVKGLAEQVAEADLEALTTRERCLVERILAAREKDQAQVDAVLDRCLEKLPDDPYLLNEKGMRAWGHEDYLTAERIFRRLAENAPNWVIAYNQLGYISMLQERFVEAREYFVSYRFIAPDQANPYDSLGELYIIQGQWDDARASLEQALAIKPDFWNSYEHLVLVLMLMEDFDAARDVIARMDAQEQRPQQYVDQLTCLVDMYEMADRRDDLGILEAAENGCVDEPYQGALTMLVHAAAIRLGRWEQARAIEDRIQELLDKQTQRHKWMIEVEGMLAHLRGVRLAALGRLEAGLEKIREADAKLIFRGAGIGLFKLNNQLAEVEVLLAAGDDAAAHRKLSEVRFVNPTLVALFENDGLQRFGIARR